MAEETKIVKKETKSDQAKTGASKVQIRQVDIAIIQAQREKAMKEGQKKAEASQKGYGQDRANWLACSEIRCTRRKAHAESSGRHTYA